MGLCGSQKTCLKVSYLFIQACARNSSKSHNSGTLAMLLPEQQLLSSSLFHNVSAAGLLAHGARRRRHGGCAGRELDPAHQPSARHLQPGASLRMAVRCLSPACPCANPHRRSHLGVPPRACMAWRAQVTVDLKLSLPQVAVIGSQSSGKSSVLEALVRAIRSWGAAAGGWACAGEAASRQQRVMRILGKLALLSSSAPFVLGQHGVVILPRNKHVHLSASQLRFGGCCDLAFDWASAA